MSKASEETNQVERDVIRFSKNWLASSIVVILFWLVVIAVEMLIGFLWGWMSLVFGFALFAFIEFIKNMITISRRVYDE
ncbi:MAG: hypothetical protein COB22_05915 [Cycloclasticus sp.]|nr:MAG: hypothetical protein COB22_05915 [Cycloclasticus sp.]